MNNSPQISVGLHYSYIGTGYLFAYDEGRHKVGGVPFSEKGMF